MPFLTTSSSLSALVDTDPESLHAAPVTTPVGRLDEVKAAKELDCAHKAAAKT